MVDGDTTNDEPVADAGVGDWDGPVSHVPPWMLRDDALTYTPTQDEVAAWNAYRAQEDAKHPERAHFDFPFPTPPEAEPPSAAQTPSFEGIAIFTGKKDVFASGAEREAVEGRGRPELLSPFAIIEAAQIAEFGSVKYSDRNWEKGMKLTRFMGSMYRHLLKLHMGMTDENHAAMLMWNSQGFIHTRKLISLGLLPASLDDMPHYSTRTMEAFAKYLDGE